MQNINRVLLTGNLTRDPELKEFGSTKVCNMRLAVNNRVKQGEEWVDQPCYFDIAAFGSQGENCAKFLSKGRPVAIDGRLHWREWTTDGGDKRQAVSVIASSVQFLDSGKRDDEPGAGQQATAVSPAAADEDDIPF